MKKHPPRAIQWVLAITTALVCAVQDPRGGCKPEKLFVGPRGSTGYFPISVASADLDADGSMDLVFANYRSQDVSILMGTSSGEFRSKKAYSAYGISNLTAVATGDLNADGKTDFAVGGEEGLEVFFGKGNGEFRPGSYLTPKTRAIIRSMAVEDLNEDGRQDLVVVGEGSYGCPTAEYSGAVSVFLNNGDGTFRRSYGQVFEGHPEGITISDFNNDNHRDLAVAYGSEHSCCGSICQAVDGGVKVLLGNGDGSFRAPLQAATGSFLCGILSHDLDGDGQSDLIVGDDATGEISLLKGTGDGEFVPQAVLQGRSPLCSMALLDANQDGLMDFAIPGGLCLASGAWTFESGAILLTRLTVGVVASGDFNRDGAPDLVAADTWGSQFSLFMNQKDGTFIRQTPYGTGRNPVSLATADFNRDGHTDIATVDSDSEDISVFLARPDGSFWLAQTYSAEPRPRDIAAADFDGDGNPDLAIAHENPGGVAVRLGRGDGHFGEEILSGLGVVGQKVVAADLNHDGQMDLALSGSNPNAVHVMIGEGDGRFRNAGSYDLPSVATNLAAADLNGDGLSDLVAAHGSSAGVSVLMNHGDGSFTPAVRYVSGIGPSAIAVGDLDLDGDVDLGIADSGSGEISILENAGDGTFSQGPRIKTRDKPSNLRIGDFDGDGEPDIAFTRSFGVGILRGLGHMQFSQEEAFDGVVGPLSSIAQGDFNDDRFVDLVVSGPTTNRILVMLNQSKPPNHLPIARAHAASTTECTSPLGALVSLDGGASEDPDSTPGTNDDIVYYVWFEDYGKSSERWLGYGPSLEVNLPLGPHKITLFTYDKCGDYDADEVALEVVDTTPPKSTLILTPGEIWPPNHKMVEVTAAISSTDACGPTTTVLESVTSNEADDAVGLGDGDTTQDVQEAELGSADYQIAVRAERDARGNGRIYTFVYRTRDRSGNSTLSVGYVRVPK